MAKKAKKRAKKKAKKTVKKKAKKKRPSGKAGGKRAAKKKTRKARGRAPKRRPAGAVVGSASAPPRPVRARRFVPDGSDALLIVMSGPSGAGKSTLARRVALAESRIWRSVSMTTRPSRAGEIDGIDYIFVMRDEFRRGIERGAMLEHATVHGELYGTPRGPVLDRLSQRRDVLLEIDVQGAMVVREAAPEAVLIFVVPPSRDVLEQRLRERRSEDEGRIQARLRAADEEVNLAGHYDYLVVNDDLERAAAEVLAIVSAERNRVQRRQGFAWAKG